MSKRTTSDADGHRVRTARDKHSDPSHHVGPCSPACRAGRVVHHHRLPMGTATNRRLYRGGAKGAQLRRFKARYGSRKGAAIYGAVVGKIRRARQGGSMGGQPAHRRRRR